MGSRSARTLASCSLGASRPTVEVKNVLPTHADWRQSWRAIMRGSVIGFLIGVLPAAGATMASFVAYIVERKAARDPARFGKGAIEGVAGPESANNAASAGAMVPMLSLGVPGSGTTAVILGALIMFGLRPGPELFVTNADLVWAVIASMYIGNVLLLVMNLPLAGLFAQLLKVPYRWLYPPILALCIAGVFSQSNSIEDCWLLVGFGVLGWIMKRYDWPAAPMVLGLVLGPLLENALRQSLTLSHGSSLIFLSRPISAVLLVSAIGIVLVPFACKYFIGLGSEAGFQPVITITEVFSFVMQMILVAGAVFEMPVLIYFLTRIGIVTPAFLWHWFGYAFFIIWVGNRFPSMRGRLVGVYFLGYGLIRFLMELIRTDTTFRLIGLSRNGWVSVGVMILGAIMIWWKRIQVGEKSYSLARKKASTVG